MAKHSVNVLIKARDEASRKFLHIGGAARIMGGMLKGVGSTIKTAFVTALKAAKYAAIGLGVALATCIHAAIKQESAEVELASALKVSGQYSEAAMQKLKGQAAAIQDVTTYGDEYIMTLQRMALTLGVTADEATNAAKGAIAFHAGFGGGKGKPEIFLRYYIDFLRGTGTSLASYVGELRKAKTQEEKMLIAQKAMAYGWNVAMSRAESAGGALKQMANKLGDIREIIGDVFTPTIRNSAKAITAWARENEANIAWWAEKTFSYVTLVKDVFLDFVVFMKEDWRAGLSFAFGSFLELLKATFKSAVILSIAGGKGIWKGVKEGLLGEKEHRLEERIKQLYEEKEKRGEIPLTESLFAPGMEEETVELTPLYRQLRKEAESQLLGEKTESILGGSLNAAANTFKEAVDNIFEDMPGDLRKGYEESKQKHLKRLEELGEMPGKKKPEAAAAGAGAPEPFSISDVLAKSLKNIRSEIIQKLAPREAGYLTFAPGKRFGYEQQIIEHGKRQVSLLATISDSIKALVNDIRRRGLPSPLSLPGPVSPPVFPAINAAEIGSSLLGTLKQLLSPIPAKTGLDRSPSAGVSGYEKQTANNTASLTKSFKELLRTTREMAGNIARMNRRNPVGSELVVSSFA